MLSRWGNNSFSAYGVEPQYYYGLTWEHKTHRRLVWENDSVTGPGVRENGS